MSDQNPLDQRIKRALSKLSKIRKIFLLIELWLKVVAYEAYNARPRAHVHWIGPKRPRRPERLFIAVVYVWAIVLLEAHQLLVWSVIWGSLSSMFVVTRSFAMLRSKKSDRWTIKY